MGNIIITVEGGQQRSWVDLGNMGTLPLLVLLLVLLVVVLLLLLLLLLVLVLALLLLCTCAPPRLVIIISYNNYNVESSRGGTVDLRTNMIII